MNKYFPYPVKKKNNTWKYLLIIILIGAGCILYIDHVTKSFFSKPSFNTSTTEEVLKHKFNPKETEVEIVETNNGYRVRTPQEIIAEVAKEENFKDVDYLVRLSACESSLGERMTNTKGNKPKGSKDRGWYQISDYWHKEVSDECSYDLRCSTKWVIEMIRKGQQHQWVCDKYLNN